MEEGLKKTIIFIGVGALIFFGGTVTCLIMQNVGIGKNILETSDNLTGINVTDTTKSWLSGKWDIAVIDDWSNVIERYNVSINSYMEDIYFTKENTVVGKGTQTNDTIFVQTYQDWSKYGNLMISIIDPVKMRAVPETNEAKWILLMKL